MRARQARRPAAFGDAGMQGDAVFGLQVAGLGIAAGIQVELQEFLAAAAEQRQQAMRGDLRQRFHVVEVVAEFFASGFLALDHLRADQAVAFQPAAQFAQQRRVFRPAFDQDRARAFQRSLRVSHALVRIDERCREGVRQPRRIGQQAIGQGLEPGLAGDLRARAALLLVRQVEVFQPRLAVGGVDLRAQCVGELALFGDAGEDRRAAVFHLAQVGQARFEVAQLGVVQPAGHFLPVASDEGHGRALVEQSDRGMHLRVLCADFGGDGLGDLARERVWNLGHSMAGTAVSERNCRRRFPSA